MRPNLRSLYPFAHQIIVVEGAVAGASSIATPDGHSTDGTLESLYQFKQEEDPWNKLEIVTRDSFWYEKEEQSQAFALRATGDYLWIIDIDEFYRAQDMRTVLNMLLSDAEVTSVFFKQITFWGGFDYISDGWYLRQRQYDGPGTVLRLSRWGPGYRYVSHRPITMHDRSGRDVGRDKPINGALLARQGIFMYHYALVFPRQVKEKSEYYSGAEWARTPRMNVWAENAYTQLRWPFHVHNVYKYPSWLDRFAGRHPDQIEALRADLASSRVSEPLRPTDDIESLLGSRRYHIGRAILKGIDPFARFVILQRRRLKNMLSR